MEGGGNGGRGETMMPSEPHNAWTWLVGGFATHHLLHAPPMPLALHRVLLPLAAASRRVGLLWRPWSTRAGAKAGVHKGWSRPGAWKSLLPPARLGVVHNVNERRLALESAILPWLAFTRGGGGATGRNNRRREQHDQRYAI